MRNAIQFQTLLLSWQALEWIEEYGEAYLASHTHLGTNNSETEALLKEHYEFRNRAKVSDFLSFFWDFFGFFVRVLGVGVGGGMESYSFLMIEVLHRN